MPASRWTWRPRAELWDDRIAHIELDADAFDTPDGDNDDVARLVLTAPRDRCRLPCDSLKVHEIDPGARL